MYHIAICDDEKIIREDLKAYVSACMEEKDLAFAIDTFESGTGLLLKKAESPEYDIIFLDINMKDKDGITVAQEIRKDNERVFLVFVTAYVDYSLEGYKVDAIRYLIKGSKNFRESIEECIDAILKKMNARTMKKTFKFAECVKEIPSDNLLYIESKLHKLEFHVMGEEPNVYTMHKTLNELEKELKDWSFIRIHQSFLVNVKYVTDISGYKARLKNGEELMIPKQRYREVKDAFIKYQGEL